MPEMYCPKCGQKNPEGSSFCSKCGTALVEVVPAAAGAPQAVKTSGMATAAMVLGLVGLLLGFLAIPAIIFGILGIVETNKNPDLKGRGMAIAGLVMGGVVLVFSAIVLILILTSLVHIGGVYR